MDRKDVGFWVRMVMVLCVAARWACAQPVDHLSIDVPASIIANGVPFPATIRALEPSGQIASGWNAVVEFTAFRPQAGKVVITEIQKSGGTVEIANLGDQQVDLSNWELTALAPSPHYYGPTGWETSGRLRFPVGTWLPPKGTITWSQTGTPLGAFLAFTTPKRFSFEAIRLLDGTGRLVDEVPLQSPSYSLYDSRWNGAALGYCPTSCSFSRVGYANHRTASDWTTNLPSLGVLNPGLNAPWAQLGTAIPITPSPIQLTNGVWTGSVTVSGTPSGAVWFTANTEQGISGTTPLIEVIEPAPLTLVIPPAASAASETHAGPAGFITVRLPATTTKDVLVTLSLSDTNDFLLAPRASIPAGTDQVLIPITNLDDTVADGDALVSLTATAPGFAPATATLINTDNESGALFVAIPDIGQEDGGFGAGQGHVDLLEPAQHDILVHLDADPPLEVPSTLVISKGTQSQSFKLRMENDSVVNPSPWELGVRAHTGGWPLAKSTVRMADDEDGAFSLSLPTYVIENSPATGSIVVKTPYQRDTLFTLLSTMPRLRVPATVTLPAGALGVDFTMEVPNNSAQDFEMDAQVCAETAGQYQVCTPITLRDDEVNVQELVLGYPEPAVLSGQPFAFSAVLGDWLSDPQATNATGKLELLASPALAQFTSDPNPLRFTNGIWNGQIGITGEALGVQLGVSAAGLARTSYRFDLLRGLRVDIHVVDAVWNPFTQRFLVAESTQEGRSAQLTEIDPQTGNRERSLNLPQPVRRLAISNDGRIAWLASAYSTLQRVDLASWQLDREFRISGSTTNAYALDLAVLPGEPERVLAVTAIDRTRRYVTLYDHGLPFTNTVTIAPPIQSACLLASRVGEAFVLYSSTVSRLIIRSNAVVLDRSTNVAAIAGSSPTLHLTNDLLYCGTGDVLSPDTLSKTQPFPTVGSALGVPCPDWGTALFVQGGSLRSYDLLTRGEMGAHALPIAAGLASRLIRWGSRDFAAVSTNTKALILFQTPLLVTNYPELELTAKGPASATTSLDNVRVNVDWEFCVTNHGAVPAPGVELRLDPNQRYPLGSLAPGEGTSILVRLDSLPIGVFRAGATVLSALPDAKPENNTATILTRVQRRDLPTTSQLILGMTHLVASPSGDRLYASVATSAGELEDGVTVIDPEKGTVEQVLRVGVSPQHLAISADGDYLYILLGTNQITRWNLGLNLRELTLTLTNESVLDFLPISSAAGSLVVSTPTQISVFDGGQIRPIRFEGLTDRRHLGFAGGHLWTAEPGYLRSFAISGSGLTARTSMPFTLSADDYRFASDGRILYFNGAIVNTTNEETSATWLGETFCADIQNGYLFSPRGAGMRKYSLTNYALLDEQPLLPAATFTLLDPVRWGNNGLAVRCGQQLLMVRSTLVPTANTPDLGVSILAPASVIQHTPMEWTVVATNRSDRLAPRVLLTVDSNDLRDQQMEDLYSFAIGSRFYFELGDLAGHSSRTITLSGWTLNGNVTMSATIEASEADPDPSNNTASVSVLAEPQIADFGILSVSAPSRLAVGDEFEAVFVCTNAGPDNAQMTFLSLGAGSGLKFLGVKASAFPTNEYGPVLGTLGPGETKTATLRYKVLAPGLMPIFAYTSGGVAGDPENSNNFAITWVYAPPPQTGGFFTEVTMDGATMAWDRSRQQMLAVFSSDQRSLFVLEPGTLAPVLKVDLPGLARSVAPCLDGRHAWVSLAGGSCIRVDLATGAQDLPFSCDPDPSPVFAFAAPPATPDLLVVAFDPGYRGNNHLQVFDRGRPRSIGYGPIPYSAGGYSLLFVSSDRVLAAWSQGLRELRIAPDGLAEVRNLDSAALYDGLPMSKAANRLFFAGGRVVDLATGAVDDSLLNSGLHAADEETGTVYSAGRRWSPVQTYPVEICRREAKTLTLIWTLELPSPTSGIGGIIPMGTNGCVLIGDRVWLLNPARLGSPRVDLTVSSSVTNTLVDTTVNFPLLVSVTNRSPWTARQTALSLDLPTGLVFGPGNLWAAIGSSSARVDLGDLNGGTNLSFLLSPLTNGALVVHTSVTNSQPELTPVDNQQDTIVTVLPPPEFQLESSALLGELFETRPLVARLSRPPLAAVRATFTIVPGTAENNDFSSLSGTFEFAAGQTVAAFAVFETDELPELDESASLDLSSTNLTLLRSTIPLTILNDDWPQLSVAEVSLREGSASFTNANFTIKLSASAPFPVEVAFEVVPGSATPSSDYLPRQGRLRFSPGETVKAVSVPVMGDLVYEPDETAFLVLRDAANAIFGVPVGKLTILNDDTLPSPQLAIALTPAGFKITFDSASSATYTLQSRTNHTTDPWHTLPGTLQGTGGQLEFPLSVPNQDPVFYRVIGK